MNKNITVMIAVLFTIIAGCSPAGTAPEGLAEGQTLPPPEISTTEPDVQAQVGVSPISESVGIHIKEFGVSEQILVSDQPGNLWTHYDKFLWDLAEPVFSEPRIINWEAVSDTEIIQLSSTGYKVIGIVKFSPEWAQKYPGIYCGPVAEPALDQYAEFLNQLVSRYSQPPYNIHYWELGNEPDVNRESVKPRSVFGCWGEITDPYFGGGYYAEMLKRAYPQIKAADPESVVVIGGLLLDCDPINPPETSPGSGELKNCTPSKFLEGILQNGGGNYFDAVAFHSYDYYQNELGKYGNSNWHSNWDTTGPVLTAKTRYIQDILSTYGHPDKLLLNTELALLCGRIGDEPECLTDSFQLTKASYLAKANAAAVAEGLTVNMWYSLEGWRGSGLVNDQLQPNVALNAFNFSSEQMNEVNYLQDVTSLPGIKGYEFLRQGIRFWVIWALNGQAQNIQLPALPVKMHDVFGVELPPSQAVTINYSPVYIEWAP